MFCYQCEQSQKGNCHSSIGVCGKDEVTAAYQDILVNAAKGVSFYAYLLGKEGKFFKDADKYLLESLFTTVTNVNFDKDSIRPYIKYGYELTQKLKKEYENLCEQKGIAPKKPDENLTFAYPQDETALFLQWDKINIESKMENVGKTVTGMKELVIYGIKGLAAYADHAYLLGFEKREIYDKIHKIMYSLSTENDANSLLALALETGELNYMVMEVLDNAHTTTFGNPEPTPVNINPVKGKAILVSGHDLKDLEELLKQTEGKGINIYTHGEMLPAHGYPKLKKYSHLAGNYGGAWQDQHKEFDAFPGTILMTTNCIQKPRESYKDRIFTTGLVRWPGVKHIDNFNFSELIETAQKMDGFQESIKPKTILTGFGHNAVLNVADKVIEGVKSGAIKHFYLIGGCDGAKPGRNYYTDFANAVPEDSIIMTLACGKFRFNKLDFGDIGGIPRLLDIGQCNDAYSAIKIAVELAKAFDTDVNNLPLSMILSWYEQKAVAILLTLLYLGIKNIKLGPTLPQFLEPEVIQILVDKYNIAPTTTVEQDLQEILS